MARKETKRPRDPVARKAEAARRSEARFEALAALSPDIVNILDAQGRVVFVSEAAERIHGYASSELVGKNALDFIHPDDLDATSRILVELLKAPGARAIAQYRFRNKNGSLTWMEARGYNQLANPLVEGVITIAREIRSHEKSEAKFVHVANRLPDIVSIIAKDGTLIFNSAAAERIHGYTTEEMTGRNTYELIHPDDLPRVKATMEFSLANPGVVSTVQYRYRNKDGSYVWMEATADNQFENPLLEGLFTISRDITERKRNEEALHSALAARDEFLSIASHELRTPLTALQGYLQILDRRLHGETPAPAVLRQDVKAALGQAARMTSLVNDLLDATRIREGQLSLRPAPFEFASFLTETLEGQRAALEAAGCKLTIDIETIAVSGTWDRSRLTQVIENLVGNAAKYAAGSPIAVRLARSERGVQLTVADRGPGIPAEMQAHLFERFVRATSAEHVSGLGLGLYIAKRIVDAHGGRMFVKSVPGHGATFVVDLPLDAGAAAEVG